MRVCVCERNSAHRHKLYCVCTYVWGGWLVESAYTLNQQQIFTLFSFFLTSSKFPLWTKANNPRKLPMKGGAKAN